MTTQIKIIGAKLPMIKQVAASQDELSPEFNPDVVLLLEGLRETPDHDKIVLFGDLANLIAHPENVQVAFTDLTTSDLESTFKRYYATIAVLENFKRQWGKFLKLFIWISGSQFEYSDEKGWQIWDFDSLDRERMLQRSVALDNFHDVTTNPEPSNAATASTDGEQAVMPDWAFNLIRRLSSVTGSDKLKLFGSCVSLHKEPADVDVAFFLEAETDFSRVLVEHANTLYELSTLVETYWLGDMLDPYVCLQDSSYKYDVETGDWVQIPDGAQLTRDVRDYGQPLVFAALGKKEVSKTKKVEAKTGPIIKLVTVAKTHDGKPHRPNTLRSSNH